MSFSIKGKTAIVTGAANGIGLAIARHFIDQGANVMLADIDEDKLCAESAAIGSERAQCFGGDLCQKLTVANLQSATIDAFDRIDILVNASRQVLPSNPLDAKEDSFEALLKQNVLSNLRLTQSVVKLMIRQAKTDGDTSSNTIGTVINLSSIASDRTHPDLLAYSVSCAALNQMTRSLAVSLAKDRVRVNAVAIGSVMSANLQEVLQEDDDLRDRVIAITPMGRIAEAQEVAEVVQFLAAGSSSFVTGQILNVDGGRTLIDPLETAVN
ncbi:MAG: SDR family oxidoreductase [Proteobacteria bacterium]|nr:SDR family oxidoreductase [Pseudomonadota bacterium]